MGSNVSGSVARGASRKNINKLSRAPPTINEESGEGRENSSEIDEESEESEGEEEEESSEEEQEKSASDAEESETTPGLYS